MKCPHCNGEISDTEAARYIASKGGSKSKRRITPEQQAKMQAARRRK